MTVSFPSAFEPCLKGSGGERVAITKEMTTAERAVRAISRGAVKTSVQTARDRGPTPGTEATCSRWSKAKAAQAAPHSRIEREDMNNIIWLVGAIVIVLAILGFLGIR
ncbi:MAG: hypothetical protein EOS37_33030 [Mesorhizobium sp.]|nr:MAG: hypothetical protein EOS37_33030 [Mesorhizobium sp.]TIV26101.1 MAG: hypothetical protein E5V90_24650 [Mesorhizobium sp.]